MIRSDHDLGGLILPRAPYIVSMTQWQKSYTREPTKTKVELRQMLTEAVRNTQPGSGPGPKRLPQAKRIAARAADVE